MNLQEFTKNLLGKKFDKIPQGFIRMHPDIHEETKGKTGKTSDPKLICRLDGINIYVDSTMKEGEAKFIDRNGVITKLLPEENDTKPNRKPAKKKSGRKRKARSVSAGSS